MPSVSTDADGYQDLADLRERVDYVGGDFFDDNAQLRFDELLVRLEREARGIFETLWGDETPTTETDRTDIKRAHDDAAQLLAYPVQDVSKVELKRSEAADWHTLDEDRYTFSDHRLILTNRERLRPNRRANELTRFAGRSTWRDLASKIRVTYTRGFGDEPPSDIKSIQVQLVNQLLRNLKREQTVAAASPEEMAQMSAQPEVVTEEIRDRIADVTSPGGATLSV